MASIAAASSDPFIRMTKGADDCAIMTLLSRRAWAMASNPKIQALLTGLAATWLIYDMSTARETPSMALSVLQWVILAGCVIGFVGAVKQLLAGSDRNPG
jgi:hypothetical protein